MTMQPSVPFEPAIRTAERLTGSWTLARFAVERDGDTVFPLGTAPVGQIVYAPDGHMSVHLAKGADAPPDTAMPDHTAYFGRFTVDEARGEVTHHIAGASLPRLAGTEQVRAVTLHGDGLTLAATGGAGATRIDWRRAGPLVAADAPAGFAPLEPPGFFPRLAGDFHVRDRGGDAPVIGVRIGRAQSNSEGFAHGGFLLTFADLAMTIVVRGVSLNVAADFLRPARVGDWLEARIVTRKRSAGLIFADTVVTCDGRDILRSSGLFKPFGGQA